tara:strand:- start:159 stop:773 length:615 start_codon:yes stop_codon:yes gene_type:complete
MGKTHNLEAIILRAHDVGEADRFCILFTKERGKIAARARAVRKPGSKMGGSLLPLSHLKLMVREGSTGYMISDVQDAKVWTGDITEFLKLQQGIEILLSCLHDEEPLPEIFAITEKFLETRNVLAFTLTLLHHMGLLPNPDEDFFRGCTNNQKTYMKHVIREKWNELPVLSNEEKDMFSKICASLISEVSSRELKTGSIMRAMK